MTQWYLSFGGDSLRKVDDDDLWDEDADWEDEEWGDEWEDIDEDDDW